MARMLLDIGEFQFEAFYVPGEKNILADFGTRPPSMATDPAGNQYLVTPDVVGNEPFLAPVLAISNDPEFDKKDYCQLQQYNETKWDHHKCFVKVKEQWKQFVPISERRSLMWSVHQPKHGAFHHMKSALRDYHWPEMAATVQKFLSNCVCAKKKQQTPEQRDLVTDNKSPVATYPLQFVAVDIFKFKKVPYLTIVDHFSEYPVAYALNDATISSVETAINLFISMFGLPLMFLSDQGGEFNTLTEVAKHVTSAAYRPQTNGKVERLHKEIIKMCRIYSCDPLTALTYLRTF